MASGDRIEASAVLDAEPPGLDPERAAAIAARIFGAEGSAAPLASERDQNFRIDGPAGPLGVLKVSNAAEDPAVVEMESEAALHAKRVDPELPIALPWLPAEPARPEARYASVGSEQGERHLVRMFDFMSGRCPAPAGELDGDALWEFGRTTARLGRALRSFFHPAAGRVLLWDVQHAPRLRPLAATIGDPRRRALVERVIDRFTEHVAPRWGRIRSQVVHGDLSLDNVTVDARLRISGILDFGDMSHTALICDVTSAWASAVWERDGEELFAAAAALLDGYRSITPLEELELSLLADLFAARAAAAASISAVRVARHPDNEYIASFDAAAWPLLELYEELGFEEAARRFGGRTYTAAVPIDGLLERRSRSLGSALLAPTYERPLHLVEAEGVWMRDATGRRFLDAYNNVPVVGHGHPRVVEALAGQARRLNTNMRYLHEAVIELAERLLASMPGDSGLDTVMMLNSGSEANDLAWRLATAWSGNAGALVSDFAYHGISAAVADLSPEGWRGGRPDHVETFPPPTGDADRAAAETEAAIERLSERGLAPAAVMVDPAFTSDGIHPPPPGSLAAIAERTRAGGGLYVADEVQAGYARSGERLWAFAAAGVRPDVVTLGKPMGNGYPVAALITRAEIVDRFARGAEFFSTFGGNPPAAAAALAVLDVIEDQGLLARAARVGEELRDSLAALAASRGEIGAVRTWGLMAGVELAADETAPASELADRVANGLRERGVLIGTCGAGGSVLKIRPPLVFGSEHVEVLLAALEETLAEDGAAQ